MIKVHVVPKAQSSSVEPMEDGTFKVKVKAPPEKGKANEEVLRLLSGFLGVNKSSLKIVHGGQGREKFIKVVGISSLPTLKKDQT